MSDTTRSATERAMPMGDGQAVARAAQTWLSATSQCQREMMDFMSRRLEKDGVAMRDILDCRNLADAVTLHSHWMEETLRDYNAEMSKLMTIYSHSMNGGESGSGR
ncbi:phasin family protein [Microvirga sp. M2]|uniref:phasin family protein n=1 Tax=Microvirga sp. M2 TaxID=3073270 RepID=UPI0039C398AE